MCIRHPNGAFADRYVVGPNDALDGFSAIPDELGAATWAVCVDEGQGMSVTETVVYAKAAISEALAALLDDRG